MTIALAAFAGAVTGLICALADWPRWTQFVMAALVGIAVAMLRA